MSPQARVVLVTAPDGRCAEKLAGALLDAKLAACVSVVPGITSHYAWKGKRQKESEHLLIIKTRRALLARLAKLVRKKHPAQVPEIIALPVTGGEKRYLDWLAAATR